MTSKYTMEGRILMLPISGSGNSRGNYTNIEASILMQGEQIEKNGERYLNCKDFYVDFNIGHATIALDDLFNGDKELGKFHLHFLAQPELFSAETHLGGLLGEWFTSLLIV